MSDTIIHGERHVTDTIELSYINNKDKWMNKRWFISKT